MNKPKVIRQKFTGITAPSIGEMLKKYCTEKRIFQSGWARKQGINPNTVLKYFKKSTVQISTLFTICQVLNYNFFRAIANALPADMPPLQANPLQAENEELKKEIEKLKLELSVWKEVAKG